MLQVDLENILTEEDAMQRMQEIFAHVENQKEIYVITKNGRPVFAIIDTDHLEQLTSQMNATPASPAMPSPVTPPPAAMPTPAPMPSPVTPELMPMPTQPAPLAAQPNPVPPVSSPPPAAPAVIPPLHPSDNTLPPLNGSLELPNLPEDLNNDSPLA